MIQLKLLFVSLFLIESIATIDSNDIFDYTDDGNDNDDNYNKITCDDERYCKNYNNKFDLLKNLFKRVPNHSGSSHSSLQNIDHDEKFVPFYRTTNSFGYCGCNLSGKLRDLGIGYYPRFLKDGKCASRSCKDGFTCKEKHYRVRVLKHRSSLYPSALDAQPSDSALPEGLRDTWKSESVPITVACECS